MKRTFLLLILTLIGSTVLSAQPTMPDKTRVFYPNDLMAKAVIQETTALALERSSDFGQSTAPRNKTFWVVYSDRDDNPTWIAPGSTKKYSSLTLNEKLRIAQIQNGYALVYTEPQEDIEYPLISQDAVCKGWISMKKLLLWHSCPADQYDIYQKALLCVNLDKQRDSDLGKLYKNPSNRQISEKLSTNMEFYFIMKREGNLALLARNHTMDGRTDQNILVGWVAEQSYVAWNQRSCLEPTWDKRDAEYFADEGAVIEIYDEQGECATQLKFKRRQSTVNDPYLYRMPYDQLRFPILDESTEDMYQCSTFGTKDGEPAQEEDEYDAQSPLGLSEEVLQQMTNINIGIVIDGTRSMEPYYPAVKNAIKEGVRYFGDKYKVKVGVVIYRDYTDEEVTEVFRLTPADNPKLARFLDTGGEYGIKSNSRDRTLEEAMYEGINVALDRLGFNPEQSNLLLVVGDCGNDREDTRHSDSEIINKLVEKNVHMMGFQVQKGPEDAYTLFNDQLLDLIYKSLKIKYSKNVKYEGKLLWERMPDGYRLVNDLRSNLFIGSHTEPSSVGQALSANKLTELMNDAIEYTSASVRFQINLVTSLQQGGFKDSNVDSDVVIDAEYLKWKLGEDAYNKLRKELLAFKGFTAKKHKSGRSFFKPIVFLSSDELNSLIDRLEGVNSAAVTYNSDRAPYVNAMKALVQSMDPSKTDAIINNMSYNEIMNTISGLNEAAGALRGDFTIADIADPHAVSNVEYLSLVEAFKRKFKGLKRLKEQEYKYTYKINGLKYYWLPIEDLP